KSREIKRYCQKADFKKGVIGLSGGLDSALAAVLAVKALGAKNLIVVRMPYFGISDKESLINAERLAKNLKIPFKNILTIPINKPVDASWRLLVKFIGGELKIRKGNLMARERMKILFDLSQVFKAIVIGTEDRTEEELGYYTLWGDQASGIEPIRNLWKTQVYQLASFIKEIPDEILLKAPSPGLWKNQSAEEELGINYLEADVVLSAYQDLKMSKKMIVKKWQISPAKVNRILARAKIGEIKKNIPYVLKN
ncbi:MAG: NAD(+) synthase, partial [Patescibacteria group bacterium]